MNIKGRRFFISGGAGVIGSEMVKLLYDRGAILMTGDLKPVPEDFPASVIYRQGDLNTITQSEIDNFAPEIFIHLAATFERSAETYEHWEENFRHNIQLSHHMMTLMRKTPSLKRVVNASSYLIYDKRLYQFRHPQEKPYTLKESDPINPRNLTGLAKLAHEIELDFLAAFKSDMFSSVSARIYRGYGKNSRDVISRWVRSLLNGELITVYNQDGFFDYIFARDTANGLIRLALTDHTGIVNLGSGRSRQVKDIVAVLHHSFPDMQVKYESVTGELIEASQAGIDLLKEWINWSPEHDLEDTIPEIIAFERSRKDIPGTDYGNILLTSASKKIPMLKAIITAAAKISDDIKVIAGDIDDNCLAQYFSCSFWKMPRLSEINIEEFIADCRKRNISLIIPSRDGELSFFAEHKDHLRSNNLYVMISDRESVERCIDKLAFYNQHSELEKYLIPAHNSIEELNADRLVVKERFGAGALSIGIDLTREEALEHSRTLTSPIFQPFAKGHEISVDAYIDNKSVLKGIVMRRRELVVNGESQITTTFENASLENKFREIIPKLKLQGHIILQAIITGEDKIQLIECNPRFGGASTVSLKAGLDSFYWVYLESRGIDISGYPFNRSQSPVRQIRFPDDLYV